MVDFCQHISSTELSYRNQLSLSHSYCTLSVSSSLSGVLLQKNVVNHELHDKLRGVSEAGL